MTTKTRPVHEIRLGKIKAAVWRNPVDGGTRYNVTLSRLYKDEEGWRDSSSFGREDLLFVAKVCDLALDWIREQGPDGFDPPQDAA